ncbi:MAG: hypothetical protein QN194_15420 [Armatimonadota bacterium]|nr:hypothetical protein [Armatimonadota bacterium]
MADGAVHLVILAWLGAAAFLDLRFRRLPSWWWNLVPLLGAALWAGLRGGWAAPAAALSAVLLPRPWFLLSLPGLLWDPRPIPILAGALFREAWERGWLGGADACAALALLLVFPDAAMLLFLALSLAAAALAFRWHGERRFPGLVGLLGAAAIRVGLGALTGA